MVRIAIRREAPGYIEASLPLEESRLLLGLGRRDREAPGREFYTRVVGVVDELEIIVARIFHDTRSTSDHAYVSAEITIRQTCAAKQHFVARDGKPTILR
jgi:hypothetical protein